MELLQLRYFLTVAKMLNISHAAEYHMIPQPAMSKTISKLEKELGTPLFNRYKNKLSLTEQGQAFYKSVSASINEIDSVISNITQSDDTPHGEIKLLVKQHRSNVVDCIAAFKKLYPKVSFRILYELEGNDYDDIDLCIANVKPNELFDNGIFLNSERLQLVVANDHPFAKMEKVGFDMLEDEEFAIVSKKVSQWKLASFQCNAAGFDPKLSIICGDLHCLMRYVASGMAITIGAEVSWQYLKNDAVAFVNTEPELFRTTYVYENSFKKRSAVCNLYKDFLINYFSKF
ncbi:MAG: LysR family transcriptional regulator [Oscillospiraceae bacterium]|nr:LysR family transcriptional regulator [Oscillospiraceae bacterium]MBQ4538151.1 LysR family transcriptional regulator [Oscillospiraceae bacterium]